MAHTALFLHMLHRSRDSLSVAFAFVFASAMWFAVCRADDRLTTDPEPITYQQVCKVASHCTAAAHQQRWNAFSLRVVLVCYCMVHWYTCMIELYHVNTREF